MIANCFKYILAIFISFTYIDASANCISNKNFFTQHTEFFNRALKHQLQNRHLLAIIDFKLSEMTSCKENEKYLSLYHQSKSLFELDEKSEAIDLLMKIDKFSSNKELKRKSRLLLAIHNEEFQKKLTGHEQQVIQIWKNKAQPASLKEQLNSFHIPAGKKNRLSELSLQLEKDQKSPWVAGTASALIPGLGQAYNGHYQSAAMSLILNALFLGTTIEFHKKNQPWATATAGTVWSVVYIGGIISAVKGAQKVNQLHHNENEKQFQNILFEF